MKLVLSCEHATSAVPAQYRYLFEGRGQAALTSHRGWDPGALLVAQELKRSFKAPLVQGEWTRLLLDLNRSPDNPERWSDFSRTLDTGEKEAVDTGIFQPYWNELRRHISAALEEAGTVLHLSIHSFVRELDGQQRTMDAGLLFDPARGCEIRFCTTLMGHMQATLENRHRVVFNEPYAGTEDGLTRLLRVMYPENRYLGIELELRSDLLEKPTGTTFWGGVIASAVRATMVSL